MDFEHFCGRALILLDKIALEGGHCESRVMELKVSGEDIRGWDAW
jgi:hypothetical protein